MSTVTSLQNHRDRVKPDRTALPAHLDLFKSFRHVSPIATVVIGLFALIAFYILSTILHPAAATAPDTEHFQYFVSATYAYASTSFDLSVMSPYQGIGGLIYPIGVWINPAYLLPRLLAPYDPFVWTTLTVAILLATATFLLGRANGLSPLLAVLAAQLLVIISFDPICAWTRPYTHLNGVVLYELIPALSIPTTLGTALLAVLSFLGKLSNRMNVACLILMPVLLIYSILCDPLYTAVLFVPVALFLACVVLGSGSRRVFLWRVAGGTICLFTCLALNLHGYYRALSGYSARAIFPNELYVEVQIVDRLTSLIFQGGLATPAVILLITCCWAAVRYGDAQAKGLAISVLLFIIGTIGMTLTYLFSGIRWNMPLPSYYELGAHPAYIVACLSGLSVLLSRLATQLPPKRPAFVEFLLRPSSRPMLTYASVLCLPLLGAAWLLIAPRPSLASHANAGTTEPVGIVKLLQNELAIGSDGQFRGSVVSVIGVPGGGLMNHLKVPESAPYTKDEICRVGQYFRSFDPHFFMTGLWKLGIPTLEDNTPVVTPPFHFLISRALSRSQDFHSRNWAMITKSNPRLMAALGSRFLVTDSPQDDPLLTLRAEQTNGDGVTVYSYEIAGANLGNLSPIRTVLSIDASETISLMADPELSFHEVAVVHDEHLTGLTHATSGSLHFENGGVRVQAKSAGKSLLVLPVQFSNSLQIIAGQPGDPAAQVRLLRANLVQTGVLFSGEIEIKIAHVFGPFRDVDGRLRDIEDCRRLAIRETGEIPYPPNYQPHAWRRWSIFR